MNAKTFLLVAVGSGAALPAAAQNQVVNTGFVTDLGGWIPTVR